MERNSERILESNLLLLPFALLGKTLINLSAGFKQFTDFLGLTVVALFTPPFRRHETIVQMYQVGVRSAPIILFSLSFAASVTILEYAFHMKLIIQTSALVPGFAALLILRELGAVLTALLLTSRIGAGITAEVGTMQITEQIDALRLLNVDPIRYLVVPRLVATALSCAALSVLANTTCIFFAMVVSTKDLGYSPERFLTAMTHFASFKDFYLALFKALVFGSVIPVVSCYYGFHCKSGAEGVGQATTKAVVTNATSIIILDFILTYIFSYFY